MRICIAHAGDISEPSGGTDRVKALATGLEERGHDVVVVVPDPDGSIPERLSDIDVRRVSPPLNNAVGRAVSVSRRSLAVARTENRRLQFEHSVLAGVASLFARDNKFILDMHDLAFSRYDHVEGQSSPILRRATEDLERRAVKKASQVVLVSETMAHIVKTKWDISSEKLVVVPNGYFPDIVEDFVDVDTTSGRVVFLGTLHPKVDAEALCQVSELEAVSEMLVIGDGAQREKLETKSHGLDSLEIVGRLPDAEAFRYVASAEAVVNPQTSSALQRSSSPVKLYYYAALGKPIVATEGPEFLDELAKENAARAVTNRKDFISEIHNIFKNNALADTLGSNAAGVAIEHRWSSRIKPIIEAHQNLSL